MVIFVGKKPPTNPCSKHLVVKSNAKAWITEKLMLEWVEEIYNKIKLQNNCMKLLILDKCSSHLKTSVVEKIKSAGFFEFIPAGCTSLVQPLDIMVNKPFKDRLRDLFEKWINEVGLKDDNKTK